MSSFYWNFCLDSVYVFIIYLKCDGYSVLLWGPTLATGPSVGKGVTPSRQGLLAQHFPCSREG